MPERPASDSIEHPSDASGCCAPAREFQGGAPGVPHASTPLRSQTTDGMVLLPGGTFLMGSNDPG